MDVVLLGEGILFVGDPYNLTLVRAKLLELRILNIISKINTLFL